MRIPVTLFFVLAVAASLVAQPRSDEAAARRAVEAFYAAFNSHGWDKALEFATEDWNHINPFGGRTRGRNETLADLKRVHSTFLKGVTDKVESIDVRLATSDVAVATVVSQVSAYTTPDGQKHDPARQIRTFVLVTKAGRWRIMQDHNTIVAP